MKSFSCELAPADTLTVERSEAVDGMPRTVEICCPWAEDGTVPIHFGPDSLDELIAYLQKCRVWLELDRSDDATPEEYEEPMGD